MIDELKSDAGAVLAAPYGSATYRLVSRADAICPDDERLCDDCETWEKIEPTFVGQRYDGNFFVPMRRKSPNVNNLETLNAIKTKPNHDPKTSTMRP